MTVGELTENQLNNPIAFFSPYFFLFCDKVELKPLVYPDNVINQTADLI